MRKLNIEYLKKEFVGKIFNWLTVLDVFRDDHTTIMFKCQCRCGTIADVRKQYVLSCHTTSCGCYKCSHEKGDTILTTCPNCNKYDKHTLSNVYHISYGRLKLDHATLCSTCRNKLISSSYEQEIANYISTFYSGELIRNSRNIISPLELDLYYPEKNIAIEFNGGDYWHDENHKTRDYHYNKFNLCRKRIYY